MKPKEIRAILGEYLQPLPDGIEAKVLRYIELLDTWGRKIPLTSVREPEEVVRLHFGESIFALSLTGTETGNSRLADVGSGAGFPGLAMKLAQPELHLTLIEPNKKKCAFLNEIYRSLAIRDVAILASRFEDIEMPPNSMDVVTSRALGQKRYLLKWAGRILAPGGKVLLWVTGQQCKELSSETGWDWNEPTLIPSTRERFILEGRVAP